MPRLTRQPLKGIKLTMHFREHNPPHFHAKHGEHSAAMLFNGTVYEGWLPPAQLKLVSEWAKLNQAALAARWALASNNINFTLIE